MVQKFWTLISLAWLDEMLRNFLWVPLTAYCKQVGMSASFLATVFALNVGTRFVPNMIVTQIGARTELPMMLAVFAGYAIAFQWPTEPWSLYCLAVGTGMGFVRPCVTLHAHTLCAGNVDDLSEASRKCGAARTFADVCSFLLPAAVFDAVGWTGVTLFGASLSVWYLVLAIPLHWKSGAEGKAADTSGTADADACQDEALIEVPTTGRSTSILWIDWALSAAFVSTELQWNLLNSAVPAALVHSYKFPASAVGGILAIGCLVTLGYILSLPSLPKAFNKHRPLNLLITYSGMSVAWLVMIVSLIFYLPACVFVVGSYLFLAMANASQIVMLECLTGVADLEASTRIMGVSEMIGCALGMAGSYAGEALLLYGVPAPFVACGHVSLISTGFLAVCLGHRRFEIEQRAPCMMVPSLDSSGLTPKGGHINSVRSTLTGLQSIVCRADSFISGEISHRDTLAGLPAKEAATPDGGSDGDDGSVAGSAADDGKEDMSPLLHRRANRAGSDISCASTMSTARGRKMKQLAAGFPYAHVDLDRSDHEGLPFAEAVGDTLRITSFASVDGSDCRRLDFGNLAP